MKNKKLICNIIITFLLVLLIIIVSKIITIDSNATNIQNYENEKLNIAKNNTETVQRTLNIKIDKEKDRRLGDVNGDGIIDISDANIILSYVTDTVAGIDMSEYEVVKKYGDCNGDGKISIIDSSWILRYYCLRAVKYIGENSTMEELVKTFDEKFVISQDGCTIRPKE